MDQTLVRFRDFVQVLTNCSGADAMNAENLFCSSPEARNALMLACGGSVAITTYGAFLVKVGGEVTLFTGGTGAPTAVPAAAVGVALAGAGALGIKRYCLDLVKGIDAVTSNQSHYPALGGE